MVSTFVGSVGLRIRLKLGVDVGTDDVAIKYIKPDGTTGQWTGVIESATEGIIYYETAAAADLNVPGVWLLNGVHDPAGDSVFYGDTAELRVKNLGE